MGVAPDDRDGRVRIVATSRGGVHATQVGVEAEAAMLQVTPGYELLVHVIAGTCTDDATLSSPTTGVVKATFTTRK